MRSAVKSRPHTEAALGRLVFVLVVALGFPIGVLACSAPVSQAAVVQAPSAPQDPRPEFTDVLSRDCLEWAQVEGKLAQLASTAMSTYGRIDPGLFANSATGGVGLAANVPAPAPEFQRALDAIGSDPVAASALARGLAAALELCPRAGCPPTKYTVDVFAARPPAGNDDFYQWIIQDDEAPTAEQWRAFQSLYAPRPALCSVLPAVQVRTRLSGYLITHAHSLTVPGRRTASARATMQSPKI